MFHFLFAIYCRADRLSFYSRCSHKTLSILYWKIYCMCFSNSLCTCAMSFGTLSSGVIIIRFIILAKTLNNSECYFPFYRMEIEQFSYYNIFCKKIVSDKLDTCITYVLILLSKNTTVQKDQHFHYNLCLSRNTTIISSRKK